MRTGFTIHVDLQPYDHIVTARIETIKNGHSYSHKALSLDVEPLRQLARLAEDLAPSSRTVPIAEQMLAEARKRIEAKAEKALAELVQLQDAKGVYAGGS